MKTTTIVILVFATSCLHAQTLYWVDQLGGTLEEASYSIATDLNGSVFTTGQFQGTVDFDPGPGIFNLTSNGGNDIFISKLDASGNLSWAKQIGSALANSGERGISIVVGLSGNVYITGSFSDTTDFDPGEGVFNLITVPYHPSCPPHSDVFILKLNPTGNFIWAKQIGGDGFDHASAMALDADENIHVAGTVASNLNAPVDFDPGPNTYFLTSQAGAAAFVLRLNSSGEFTWAKQWYSNCVSAVQCGIRSSNVDPASLAIDEAGNVHCTGQFGCTVDFDPGEGIQLLSGSGGSNTFILKLDSSGNLQWVRQFSGSSGKGNDIIVDASGNVYSTGWFQNTVDFDPGGGTKNLKSFANSIDIFVSKLNSSGNYIWAGQLGGNTNDYGNSIDLDNGNNIYTTGVFTGSSDFNPGNAKNTLKSSGGFDAFISKLNSSGEHVWAGRLGGSSDESSNAIQVNGSDIHTTGVFRGTADFDPGTPNYFLASAGGADIFIHKMNQSLPLPFTTPTDISLSDLVDAYPNPTNGILNLELKQNIENVKIGIYDFTGKLLKTEEINFRNLTTLDLSPYLAGIYFIEISDGIKSSMVRILKSDRL